MAILRIVERAVCREIRAERKSLPGYQDWYDCRASSIGRRFGSRSFGWSV